MPLAATTVPASNWQKNKSDQRGGRLEVISGVRALSLSIHG